MRKVQENRTGKRTFLPLHVQGDHIVFIELRDLKLLGHALLIPREIPLLSLISLDQQCTDGIQDHGLAVHGIEPLQDPEQVLTVPLLLAGEIGDIKGQFPGHQPVLGGEIQHLHLKFSKLLQKRRLFLITQVSLQIEQHLTGAELKLLLQHLQPFIRIPVVRIQLQDHVQKHPGILPAHVGFADLIKNPVRVALHSPDQGGQVQIITVGHGILADGKPVIVIVLQDPFCLFLLPPGEIDMGQKQLVEFILGIDLPKPGGPLDGVLHPGVFLHPSCHIADVFLQHLGKKKLREMVVFVILLVLHHFHFVSQGLIGRDKTDRPEVAAAVEEFRTDQILHLIAVSHKIFRGDLRTGHLQEIPFCHDPDGHISPGVLHQGDHALGRFVDILIEHSLPGKGQEDTFLLLDPHQEFFQGLLAQGPFAHIVIEIKDPLVLIFQDLIEIGGTEQPPASEKSLIASLRKSSVLCTFP